MMIYSGPSEPGTLWVMTLPLVYREVVPFLEALRYKHGVETNVLCREVVPFSEALRY